MGVLQTTFLPDGQTGKTGPTQQQQPGSERWILIRALRTVMGRSAPASPSHNQSEWLGEAIQAWCAANYWSLPQLAELAASQSSRGAANLLKELEDLRLQKAIHPSPRLFQALAAAHRAIQTQGPANAEALAYQLRFATPITTEPLANRPSWWFALYCQEEWAKELITLPLQWDVPANLSSRLADYLRREMVKGGRDPISDGLPAIQTVFGPDQATLTRLHLWLIGLREMDQDELHLCMHPLLQVARNCGASLNSVSQLLTLLLEPSIQAP